MECVFEGCLGLVLPVCSFLLPGEQVVSSFALLLAAVCDVHSPLRPTVLRTTNHRRELRRTGAKRNFSSF